MKTRLYFLGSLPAPAPALILSLCISLCLAASLAVPSSASASAISITVPVIHIDLSCLTTSDPGRTFVTGTLSVGRGQQVVLTDETGRRILHRMTAADTGGAVPIRLQVPQTYLRPVHGSVTRVRVQSLSAPGVTASKPVPVELLYQGPSGKDSGGTYTVIFHGNGATGGRMNAQVIPRDKNAALNANAFSRTGYRFAGWSLKPNNVISMKSYRLGKPAYANRASVRNLAGAGASVTLYACWKGCGAQAACDWALRIAADDHFNYGAKPITSSYGCYFCGNNKKKVRRAGGDKRYYKTYVCMTFINAAYVHGAGEKRMKCTYSGRHLDGNSSLSQNVKHLGNVFRNVGKPKKSKLRPGDVLLAYKGSKNHTAMYIGGGRYIQATHRYGSWSKRSISSGKLSDSTYRWFDAVLRYRGN